MKPTEEIAVRLVGGAQSAYVQELSYFFLNLLDEVVRTNGAVIRGREIADFERLSRLSREEALAIYYKYRPAIDKQTREVLKTALKKTDDALVGQFVRAMGSRRHMTNLATIIAAQTAQGMNEVLERQNIALAKDQAALWYDVTAEAIARHQAGEPTRAVMERGVTRLANSGLETIDYISGTKTTIDAALRRHIVSQANQARNRLLMQRMDEWEWDLVFVDAHFGARPSHAEWQGQVYSRSGRSTEYPSLVDATGYGTVTGLCGANCYHYMTPYVPGYSQLPDMDYSEQERITGMTSDEYYAATQKQRRYERLIRSQKREISYLQEVRADAVKQRIRLGELQDKLRQFTHDNHLRRDYERERAWAVSKQPRALKTITKANNVLDSGMYLGGRFSWQKSAVNAYSAKDANLVDLFAKRVKDATIYFNEFDIPKDIKVDIATGIECAVSFMDKDYLLANYVIRSEKLQDEIARVIRHKGNNITIDFDLEKLSQRDRDQRIQVIFHEVAHIAEWHYTTMDEWNKQSEREYAFITGQADELPRSKSVTALQKAFTKAGINVKYDEHKGLLVFGKKEMLVLNSISEYMEEYNYLGKDAISELVAESIRYVTLHGEGKNEIADIVAGEVLEWY
jgi:hypothetical protein